MESLAYELNQGGTTKMVLLEYHTDDGYGTTQTRAQFAAYNLPGTPSTVFNGSAGANARIGPQEAEVYRARYESLKTKQTTAMLELTAPVPTRDKMYASVRLTNLAATPLENAKIYAIVYENKQNEKRYMVVDITPSYNITRLAAGASQEYSLESKVTYSSSRHIIVVVRAANGLVLQTLFAK